MYKGMCLKHRNTYFKVELQMLAITNIYFCERIWNLQIDIQKMLPITLSWIVEMWRSLVLYKESFINGSFDYSL